MNKKVEELVEWVAVKNIAMPVMRNDCKCEVWRWGRSATCPTCTAKRILSHTNLALIDKKFLWKIRAMLRGMQIKQQNDPTVTWKTSLDVVLEEFDDNIIPLAEALCPHLKTTIIDDKKYCVDCGEEIKDG